MKVVFMGGKQVGFLGLLGILARGDKVIGVVAYDKHLKELAKKYNLKILFYMK